LQQARRVFVRVKIVFNPTPRRRPEFFRHDIVTRQLT
jgi:hypothetical protein